MLVVYLLFILFPLQRADKEQRDLASRWTELGTDEPGTYQTWYKNESIIRGPRDSGPI